ncbi:hypothetical protein VTI74DRAFT_3964 [Chaetomium olivicolor]
MQDMPAYYHRELAKHWAAESVVVLGHRVHNIGPLWAKIPREIVEETVLLRDFRGVGWWLAGWWRLRMIISREKSGGRGWRWGGEEWWKLKRGGAMGAPGGVGAAGESRKSGVGTAGRVYSVDGQEKVRLPPLAGGGDDEGGRVYLFQRVRHLVVNAVPKLVELEEYELGWLPSRWGVEASRNLVRLEHRLTYERKANFLLRWHAMERLESLFLDLRAYSLPKVKHLYD